MKYLLSLLLLASMAMMPALAAPITSPVVHPDGTVTFRLQAARASEVELHCEGLPTTPMTQDGTNGIWTVTTPPLAPDIYTYTFDVDGARVVDPSNPFLKVNLLSNVSQVEVPGPDLPWQIADVPHGELHTHFYQSALTHDNRDYIVYTPPGYDPTAHKRYPVLYLLHGYSDDATAWTQAGRANVILDNLIARGQAQPMLVVMPLGYGALTNGTRDVIHDWDGSAGEPLRLHSMDQFSQTLFTEIIPQVEKEYRVSADSRSRAIAGLSMGGKESLIIGLNHPGQFSWIGAFSSGPITNFPTVFPTLDSRVNPQIRLLWISCGTSDKLYKDNQRLADWLQTKNVDYHWVQTPGGHAYRVWRRNLAAFLPLLFQTK